MGTEKEKYDTYCKEQPWRICWVCEGHHPTIIDEGEGEQFRAECKNCGHSWGLTCHRCGCGVYRAEEVPFGDKGQYHLTAVCICGYKGHGSWNIKRRKRSATVVWLARAAHERACVVCKKTVGPGEFEIDHRQALCRGGRDIVANTQILCIPCHDAKTVRDCGWRR